ncbi:L-aspartate oxidase [Zhihengliuella flava]|uniref:L-aspartate oxidase n=1 Tax=Zhihengliuella flava TaxID=1285193 RepID=A0A931GE25_9MICC|nr:FAD-binding protein [Zhihengliuella flava]MBG6083600.1 L-aspartate oxidase [Zhihengliuella flava]
MNLPQHVSLIVVGSGIAGLYAAVCAAEHAQRHRTALPLLVTKDRLQDSNTWYAQGGIAAVSPDSVAAGDSIAAHIEDTLAAGAQAGHPAAVDVLCRESWQDVHRLIALGTDFDRDGDRYALGLEGAHRYARILHHGGDATGAGIARTLIAACRQAEANGHLHIATEAFATEVVTRGGAATGVRLAVHGQPPVEVGSNAVLLATGGIGQAFAATTNPRGATGDGAALAWRAGARLADAEFVQFHPTLVDTSALTGRLPADRPALMVTEAVRGDGALLVDGTGTRFMPAIDARAELAPRDVVARAIHHARRTTGACWLDARPVERQRGTGYLAHRFPQLVAGLQHFDVDPAREPIPVTEAQHYWMGGVATNLDGATEVPGLFAVGETAHTGAHGANRLASNSLTEALVFARRAVASALAGPPLGTPGEQRSEPAPRAPGSPADSSAVTGQLVTAELARHVQEIASAELGVVRSAAGLRRALTELNRLRAIADARVAAASGVDRAASELANRALVASLIAEAALARTDSLGAHCRLDATMDQEKVHEHLSHA